MNAAFRRVPDLPGRRISAERRPDGQKRTAADALTATKTTAATIARSARVRIAITPWFYDPRGSRTRSIGRIFASSPHALDLRERQSQP